MAEANLRIGQLDNFSHVIETMRKGTILTDVTITCEGEEFVAHRVILAAGSPYFKTMFTGDLQESSSPNVEIQGVKKEAMQIILEFLYLNEMEQINNVDVLKSVLTASHMLQVHQLYQHCCKEYWKCLKFDYFKEILDIAELFDHTSLVKDITNFLANHFCDVINSNDFVLLDANRLQKLITACKVDGTLTEDLLIKGILIWYRHNSQEERSEDDFLKLLSIVDINRLSTEELTALCSDPSLNTSVRILMVLLQATTSRLNFKGKTSMIDISNQLFFFGKVEDYSVVQSFNYTTKEWSKLLRLPFMIRDNVAVVHFNEYVYFIGGRRSVSKRPTTNVDKFGLLVTSMTKPVAPMKEARCNAGAVAYGGKIYVLGGSDAGMTTFLNMELSRMLEIYDIQTDTWKLGASSRYFYNSPQAVELNDNIYVLNSNTCSSVECYNPGLDQWSGITSPSMLLPVGDTWLTPCDEKLYAFHLRRELKVLAYTLDSGDWEMDDSNKIQLQIRGIWSISRSRCSLPFIFVLDRQNQLHKYLALTKTWQVCGCINDNVRQVCGIIIG